MMSQSRPWICLAAAVAAATIVAAAGCSSPDSTSAVRSPTPHHTSTALHTRRPVHRSTPTPHGTSSAEPTPTATSPSPSGAVCVTSAQMGHCPFGLYSGITGASTDPYVDQNVWGPIPGWHQTLHATSPGRWYVTANMSAGNTGVVSFPNTGFFYNKALSGFSSIVSSFADSIPTRPGTNAEASYDIWFNHTGAIHEVMIQNDYSPGRSPSCGTWTAQRVRFGGSNGVPMHPWDLCVSGSTAYWETANGNMPSGTVDVLAMLKWLVSHGQLPARVQLGAFSYGFEISSTGSRNEDFRVSSFTVAAGVR
jgi:hypothetical protein